MKIGIFSPYLHICGGGEKYIGKIAELLSQENKVEFLTFQKVNLDKISLRLGLDLSKVTVRYVHGSYILGNLNTNLLLSKASEDYDLFINQQHMTVVSSKARRSILIQEVPPSFSQNVFELNVPFFPSSNFFSRYGFFVHQALLKLFFGEPNCETYQKIITNSNYTKRYAEEYYKKRTEVLYPPIDTHKFSPIFPKEKKILSVGRFVKSLNCKKQVSMIRTFKDLCDHGLTNWEYHLVGGVTSDSYLKKCRDEAEGYSVYFHTDASFEILRQIYGKAMIFWHATGLGEDELYHPERFEHFGISTVEAMSAGCVPLVINRGGPREVINHKTNGFLWDSLEELKKYTLLLANNPDRWSQLSQASIIRSKEFDVQSFKNRLTSLFQTIYIN